MSDCDYCPDDETAICASIGPRLGYQCTRPDGHDGPCVACTLIEHEVAEWTDEDAERYSDDEFTNTGVGDA